MGSDVEGSDDVIRVIVVDDHDLFRTGLASLLSDQPGIDVIAQASGGRMGVRLAGELRPDVVLMDLRMPDLDGQAATRQIVEDNPDARVVVLTVISTEADIAAALSAGACGFVTKDTAIEGVTVAIRAAAQGASWLSPPAAELILRRMRAEERPDGAGRPLDELSARELEVLRLLAQGMENSEIATQLAISPRTAKNHVSNILTKLDLSGRVQAAIFAIRHGVID